MYKLEKDKDHKDVKVIVENIHAKNIEKGLEMNTFATLTGIRGMQFNREIYSSVIPFKDLMQFLEVFPDVQRTVAPRRVRQIKKYVLSGLENGDAMRFFSAVTVTCRGQIFYGENEHRIAIDTSKSKLSVNDGQHRMYGIAEAIAEMKDRIRRMPDGDAKVTARAMTEQLENWVIPIIIFNHIGEVEEKQLFHDLNNLAQRPSRSTTIKLAQTDILSRIARELSEKNRYLKSYGVEMDKMSIHGKNHNSILLTTVHAFIENIFVYRKSFINEENYVELKREAEETLNLLFQALPHDFGTRGKYILENSYSLRAIGKFINDCRQKREMADADIFAVIKSVDWAKDVAIWKEYGGTFSKTGKLQFGGSGETGMYAVYHCLEDVAVGQTELFDKELQPNV